MLPGLKHRGVGNSHIGIIPAARAERSYRPFGKAVFAKFSSIKFDHYIYLRLHHDFIPAKVVRPGNIGKSGKCGNSGGREFSGVPGVSEVSGGVEDSGGSEEFVEVIDELLSELSPPSLLFAISSIAVPTAAMAITAQAATKILYFTGIGGDGLFCAIPALSAIPARSAVLGIAFTEEALGTDIVRGKVLGE